MILTRSAVSTHTQKVKVCEITQEGGRRGRRASSSLTGWRVGKSPVTLFDLILELALSQLVSVASWLSGCCFSGPGSLCVCVACHSCETQQCSGQCVCVCLSMCFSFERLCMRERERETERERERGGGVFGREGR